VEDVLGKAAARPARGWTTGPKALPMDERRARVAEMYADGLTTYAIASELGCSQATIAKDSAALGAVQGDEGSSDRLFELLTPLIQQAIESAQGRDAFTGAPLEGSPVETFAKGLVEQTAPGVLAHNLTDPSATYPMSTAESLERFGLGSFAPRTTSREALNESAGRENVEGYTPAEKARRAVYAERQEIYTTMKRDDPNLLDASGRLPAPVRQAYNRKAEVEAARAAARDSSDGDSAAYYRSVAVAEARLLEEWGAVDPGFAREVARKVKTLPVAELKSGVRRMRDDLMPGAYRDITSAGSRYLERRSGVA
jgi:hypothetical protein